MPHPVLIIDIRASIFKHMATIRSAAWVAGVHYFQNHLSESDQTALLHHSAGLDELLAEVINRQCGCQPCLETMSAVAMLIYVRNEILGGESTPGNVLGLPPSEQN